MWTAACMTGQMEVENYSRGLCLKKTNLSTWRTPRPQLDRRCQIRNKSWREGNQTERFWVCIHRWTSERVGQPVGRLSTLSSVDALRSINSSRRSEWLWRVSICLSLNQTVCLKQAVSAGNKHHTLTHKSRWSPSSMCSKIWNALAHVMYRDLSVHMLTLEMNDGLYIHTHCMYTVPWHTVWDTHT